jgi:uncharacterized membrane protein
MTQHGKVIITLGIGIFTASCLLWILLQDWRWFASGAAVFMGTILTAIVLSIETKSQEIGRTTPNFQPQAQGLPYHQRSTPPPDEENDPFRT